jgi:hypothetical protein
MQAHCLSDEFLSELFDRPDTLSSDCSRSSRLVFTNARLQDGIRKGNPCT